MLPQIEEVATHLPSVLTVSGRSEERLRGNAGRVAEWMENAGEVVALADIAYTLTRRRSHQRYRAVVLARGRTEAVRCLRRVAAGQADPRVVYGEAADQPPAGPVFVFSGQGSQIPEMGRALLETEPEFRAAINQLEPAVLSIAGFSITAALLDESLPGGPMVRIQPAICAFQLGLVRVWAKYGVRPAAVVGHSMGEVAAAAVAGILTLEEAMTVICRRSRLLDEHMTSAGSTALVALAADQVGQMITSRRQVEIAGYISPNSTLIAGDANEVAEILRACSAQDITASIIPGVAVAAHSSQIEPFLPRLIGELSSLNPAAPEIPFYSTVLEEARRTPAADGTYWAANLRRSVRLLQAVRALAEDGYGDFIELAARPIVAHSIVETLVDAGVRQPTVTASQRRDTPAGTALTLSVATRHCMGAPADWSYWHPSGEVADVPANVWQHRTYRPAEPLPSRPLDAPELHPLLGPYLLVPGDPKVHVWQTLIDPASISWTADHRIRGVPVMPATAYCEMFISAARAVLCADVSELSLRRVACHAILPLSAPVTVTTKLISNSADNATAEILSETNGRVIVHATAEVLRRPAIAAETVSLAAAAAEHTVAVDTETTYAALQALGLEYGPAFRGLAAVSTTADRGSCLSRIQWPGILTFAPAFACHPAFLDACLHGLAATTLAEGSGLQLPIGFDFLDTYGDPAQAVFVRARVGQDPGGTRSGELLLLDGGGRSLLRIGGYRVREVDEEAMPVSLEGILSVRRWDPAACADASVSAEPQAWLLVGVADDARAQLAASLSGAGHRCIAIAADLDALGDALDNVPGSVHGVVMFPPRSAADEDQGSICSSPDEAYDRTLLATRLAAVIARKFEDHPEPPRFYQISVGAQQVSLDASPNLADSGLPALVRVLRIEHPQLRATSIDVGRDDGYGDLVRELLSDDPNDAVALRDGRRFVARFVTCDNHGVPQDGNVDVVRRDGAYLITGGTRGLGWQTASWLAQQGAGCIVINGRSEPAPDIASEWAQVRETGCVLLFVQGDIGQPRTAQLMVESATAAGFPPCGVIHAAAVLDDALIVHQQTERMRAVWDPKAAGAWQMHQATLDCPLDWWVVFSSAASTIGSPGQSNYATANAYAEALAGWRRAHGLPGSAVNWGPWADVGMVQARTFPGVDSLRTNEGIRALHRIIAGSDAQAQVLRLRPFELLRVYPQLASSALLSTLLDIEAGTRAEAHVDWEELAHREPDQFPHVIDGAVQERICAVLGLTGPELARDRGLVFLGLDSLAAITLRHAVLDGFDVDLSMGDLLSGASADRVIDIVTTSINARVQSQNRKT